jgi:hypothetical protein
MKPVQLTKTQSGRPVFGEEMTGDEYESLRDEHFGLCIACGYEHYDCEPDARRYVCEQCDARSVFGIEELLMLGGIRLVDRSTASAMQTDDA